MIIIGLYETPWQVPPDVDSLRVAVLGAGKMARLHLTTLREMGGVRLVGIGNRSSDAGERLAREFGIESVHRSLEALLDTTHPDAVFVAVSPEATGAVAAAVLERRIPCLIEKPVAYSASEVARLAALAAAGATINLVGLNRRFYAVLQQALLAVLQRGPVRGVLIEAHEPIGDYRSRGQFEPWVYDNWMISNTIHAIDLFRMIGGEVTAVRASARRVQEPHGDNFAATLELAGGALGSFVSHWQSPRGMGIKIYGDGIAAELWPLEQGWLRDDGGRRTPLAPGWADTRFKPGLYAQNATFLQSVCERAAAPFPASDLHDNVQTMRVIETILAAAGRSPADD